VQFVGLKDMKIDGKYSYWIL